MKFHLTLLSVVLIAAAPSRAQEGRAAGAAAPEMVLLDLDAGAAARGIEKKDIRRGMVIARPGSITPHARQLPQLEPALRQVLDAIAGGGKMTKADAARTAPLPPGLASFAAQVRQAGQRGRLIAAVVSVTPIEEAGSACGPSACGSCVRMGPYCLCLSCDPLPQDAVASLPVPDQEGAESVAVVFLVSPETMSPPERQELARAGFARLARGR
ncbi:MAG: hypothetical protein NZR01_10065 [Bryobacteraceae bacterium]|nr:hypothetical protein [Bryobacteraceae bacterium]